MNLGDLLKLDDTGVKVADYEDIREEIRVALLGIYGADMEVGPETKDGALLDLYALGVHDVGDMAARVYNNMNPLTAEGDALRRWATLQGITPKAPTASTINIIITIDDAARANNYTFGKVRISEPGNPGVVWVWDGKLPSTTNVDWYWSPVVNGKTSFAGIAVCETTGPVMVVSKLNDQLTLVSAERNAANISKIVAGSFVVVPATSTTPRTSGTLDPVQASVGLEYESDDALKLRIQKSFAMLGTSTVAAMEAALNNIVGVREAKVYENSTDSTMPVTSYSTMRMEAHSVLCLIRSPYIAPRPDFTSALVGKIFDVLRTKKSPGCGLSVGIGNTGTTTNGTPIVAGAGITQFLLAQQIAAKVTITIAPGSSYTSALETLIVNAVVKYFDTVALGQIVYQPDITCVVRDVIAANGGGSKVVGASLLVGGVNTDRWNGAQYFYGYPVATAEVNSV